MRKIGVRELRESLAEVLRGVEAGEHVRLTSRGRALADIVPVGSPARAPRLEELVRQGRIVPPSRGRPAKAPRMAKSDRSASATVLAERDLEP